MAGEIRGLPEKRREGGVEGKTSYLSRSGALSSFLTTIVTFPIYKLVFRQQVHAVPVPEALDQLRREGLRRFYRGVFPPLLTKTMQGALQFGAYNRCLHLLSPATEPPLLEHRWAAGFVSGVLEAVVLSPFERVQNVLQDGRKDVRFPGTLSILREFNSYGPWGRLALGYYRGFCPILLRNSLGSALYFSFKDPIRDRLAGQGGLPLWVPSLVSGTLNGTVISLMLYPLSVLGANMQSQVGSRNVPGLWASARAVWETRDRKLPAIYRGGSLVILRSGVSWGLTTAIHDFLQANPSPGPRKSR
ncbi:solute carrier family 25 member 53 [Tachyglossus aculeatus]|uniref:solute carrier family 25 member 53 n=1 Tax=Tachyglossus aculeatus TaxID=9261 RepID=UPI0018F59C8D|nr:solute carrier family 25 member 53 [Tachyglossus aculeatus]